MCAPGVTSARLADRVASTLPTDQPIPPELDQLVADCLATEPDQGPASAEDIIVRLGAIELAEPWNQQAARSWWAANARRLGTAGHEVAVSAERALQQTTGSVPDAMSG